MGDQNFESPTNLFEITDVLGEGSYANVYKGKFLKNGKIVAIKILPFTEDSSDLQKEIEILENCNNVHIVQYYGCYHDKQNEDFWIVMEYCEAGSISDLMGICNLLLEEKQIAPILKEILSGLKYIHKKKLIHRDIKGGNILLNKEGRVKISDFGVSVKLATTLSKRNTVIGTPYWMAPEVLTENLYNTKADIWSLGITAIELAMGNTPFSDIHPLKAVFVIPKKPAPRLPSSFSKKFRDFVKQCLQKEPNKRPSADNLLKHPFIRSAGSKTILKKMFGECFDTIQKFRDNYEIEQNGNTSQSDQLDTIKNNEADSDENYSKSGTVVINSKSGDNAEKDFSDNSLLFDDDNQSGLEDYDDGTIVMHRPESTRDRSMEKTDFSEPRPLRGKPGGSYRNHDTFEFFGRVPKKGHKYVSDYYCDLTLGELNTILLEMESSFQKQKKSIEANYHEERNIVEYAIRVLKGEQSVVI